MKQFIDNLISRLEENANQKWLVLAERNGYERAIQIVNQLAEEYKPRTNADKIRAMTDEELASFSIGYNGELDEFICSDDSSYDNYEAAINHQLEWLHYEVKEG